MFLLLQASAALALPARSLMCFSICLGKKKWNKITWCWGCKSFHYSSTQTLLPSNAQKIQSGWWGFPAYWAAWGEGEQLSVLFVVLFFSFNTEMLESRVRNRVGNELWAWLLSKEPGWCRFEVWALKNSLSNSRWISRKGLQGGQGGSLLFVPVLFNSSEVPWCCFQADFVPLL